MQPWSGVTGNMSLCSSWDPLNVQILGSFTVPNTVAEEKETSLRKIKRKPSISKSLPRVLEASLGSSDPPSADSLV